MTNLVDVDTLHEPGGKYGPEEFYGSFASEIDAGDAFDRAVAASNLFERNFKQVRGYYLAHRPNRQNKDAIIDRVLLPGEQLKSRGWTSAIGVELKRSGEHLGPALCQAIDYTYCAFNVGPHWLNLTHIFLYPLLPQRGAVRSVMVQNCVGALYDRRNSPLIFELERQVIRLDDDGTLSVHSSVAGTKKGSR